MKPEILPETKKNTSVKVIGWIFIVIGGLMIFSGVMALIVHSSIRQMGGSFPPMSSDAPGSFHIMATLFEHIVPLVTIQITFGVFMSYAGSQFLKLRPWARAALEIISWLGLAYVICFGIFFINSWVNISTPAHDTMPPMFNTMGLITAIVIVIVQAAPIVVIIKFLRGPAIRDAFKQKHE